MRAPACPVFCVVVAGVGVVGGTTCVSIQLTLSQQQQRRQLTLFGWLTVAGRGSPPGTSGTDARRCKVAYAVLSEAICVLCARLVKVAPNLVATCTCTIESLRLSMDI